MKMAEDIDPQVDINKLVTENDDHEALDEERTPSRLVLLCGLTSNTYNATKRI